MSNLFWRFVGWCVSFAVRMHGKIKNIQHYETEDGKVLIAWYPRGRSWVVFKPIGWSDEVAKQYVKDEIEKKIEASPSIASLLDDLEEETA